MTDRRGNSEVVGARRDVPWIAETVLDTLVYLILNRGLAIGGRADAAEGAERTGVGAGWGCDCRRNTERDRGATQYLGDHQ